MQYKLGFEPKMYIGPAGSAPATEAKNVKDVTVNLESAEVDASSRQSGIFKFYLAGQIDPSIEFTMNADADDTVPDDPEDAMAGTWCGCCQGRTWRRIFFHVRLHRHQLFQRPGA